ncbi:hypothetical protein [Uliginosibacterium sp. H1]|uniref:hypothetical protein n=1 Tax=Uliginosibacterium sp. H1 TaxID=3114757 RepID=UPI002E1743F8|nr:hypothetical protein [Uliginosibacterium sp. H1]
MKQNILLAGFAAGILLAGPCAAQTASTPAAKAPPQISHEEFSRRFKSADKAGKGALSRDQALKAFPNIGRYWDDIDTNRDGAMTLAEVDAAWQRAMDRAMSLPAGVAPGGSSAPASDTAPVLQVPPNATAQRRMDRQAYYEQLLRSDPQGSPTRLDGGTEPVPIIKKSF